MKAPVFPIFTLKVKSGLVILGGGGGDKKFGKMNGVIILDSTTTKDIGYYETDDIIMDICVYDPVEDVGEIEEDDMSWDEYDEDNGTEPHATKADANSGIGRTEKDSKHSRCSDAEKVLYLSCSGESFFYMLKFEDRKLVLMKRIERRVSSQMFLKDLYLITDGALLGFYDVTRAPDVLDDLLKPEKKRRKINSSLLDDESHEEYTYRLFRKGRRIVFKREEGRSDILNNWKRFFIVSGMVHKVVVEEERHTFVHNSRKYSYNKEIGEIVYGNGMLVYYLKGRDSVLYFQNENERMYNISKITAMAWGDGHATIGTGDGYVYLFDGSALVGRKKVSEVPITGVGFMGGHVYFSSLDGLVDRRSICGRHRLLYVLVAISMLVAAILAGMLVRK